MLMYDFKKLETFKLRMIKSKKAENSNRRWCLRLFICKILMSEARIFMQKKTYCLRLTDLRVSEHTDFKNASGILQIFSFEKKN